MGINDLFNLLRVFKERPAQNDRVDQPFLLEGQDTADHRFVGLGEGQRTVCVVAPALQVSLEDKAAADGCRAGFP
jgi:hypothetical protein